MEEKYVLLPADDAVQNWFEENIDKECSASSAVYKFRLWLKSLQVTRQVGAVWVKAAKRLPDSWHLKCARFIHTKIQLLDPGAWVKDNQEHIGDVEWLDESPAAKEEGKLTQSRADLIREANNRDLDGTAAAMEEDAVEKLKSSLDYYRGIIAGLGDSETDDFNRSVYFQHSGDLYTAIKIIEKYEKYFNEFFKQQKDK